MARKKQFTVSDGELVLILEPAEEGGYVVTSPYDPELVTEGETIEEALEMARDAAEELSKVRAELFGTERTRLAASRRRRLSQSQREPAPSACR